MSLYINPPPDYSKPGAPTLEGYFTQKSTVNGGAEGSDNPLIPAGFKPYEQSDGAVGDTGTAYWKDANGKPSANSLRQGLVIENPYLGEFVWIPVPDINKMIMCQSKQATGQCDIIKQNGQLYCKKHNSYDICGKLYNNSDSDGETFDANRTNQTYTKDSGRREPDLITKYDTDSRSELGKIGLTAAQFEKDMITDFKKMAVSTYDHGGFWIGRYETSLSWAINYEEGKDGTMQSKRNVRSLRSSFDDGSDYLWYKMYNKEKTENINYSTHMFWRM